MPDTTSVTWLAAAIRNHARGGEHLFKISTAKWPMYQPLALTTMAWLLLHAPGGREVSVNSKHINSLRAGEGGAKNKLLTGDVRCVISMNDGKLLNVIETCAQVRRQIDELEKRQ